MPGRNEMDVRILEDGVARIDTGNMAGVQHKAADAMIHAIRELLGGAEDVQKAEEGHHHHDDHEHGHGHDHHHA